MPQREGSSVSWLELRKSTTSKNTLWALTSANFFSYTISGPSTNLSSVAIVCKWFIYVIWEVFSSARSLSANYNLLCAILCRSKMLECKRDEIKHIGFIDPDTMHEVTIEDPIYNRDTPETLLRFLKRQRDKKIILWPYNFKWVLLSYKTFLFFSRDVQILTDDLYIWHCIFKRAQVPLYSYRYWYVRRKSWSLWLT